MTSDTWYIRSFKRGAWDLRKEERRKESQDISFPDRRKGSRRSSLEESEQSLVGLLNWVSRTEVDE